MNRCMNRFVVVVAVAACGSKHGPLQGDGGGSSGNGCDPALETCGDGCDLPDRDGDTWSDEVEVAMETSPTDAADHPDARGQLVFVMPYQAPPRPDARA